MHGGRSAQQFEGQGLLGHMCPYTGLFMYAREAYATGPGPALIPGSTTDQPPCRNIT
jgi:hypothetical protein